jgi:hypothetical protein
MIHQPNRGGTPTQNIHIYIDIDITRSILEDEKTLSRHAYIHIYIYINYSQIGQHNQLNYCIGLVYCSAVVTVVVPLLSPRVKVQPVFGHYISLVGKS